MCSHHIDDTRNAPAWYDSGSGVGNRGTHLARLGHGLGRTILCVSAKELEMRFISVEYLLMEMIDATLCEL
jgi:hypothetical protein